MKITEKLVIVKTALGSLINHDDAPEKEMDAALDDARKFIDQTWAEAKKRRAAAAKAKALPQ